MPRVVIGSTWLGVSLGGPLSDMEQVYSARRGGPSTKSRNRCRTSPGFSGPQAAAKRPQWARPVRRGGGRWWRSTPADGATSRRGAERRVLEHAWLVLDQLDAAVESPVLDHLEGDVRVAVVDAFLTRGPGNHREHPDPEAVDEAGFQQGPAQAEAADRAEEPGAILLHGADRFDGVIADECGVGPRQWLLERGGEHHLGRVRELVDGRLFLGPELVLAIRDLARGEARHQAVGLRSHQVR